MRIAHFVSGFPVQSETFVLDEIAAFASEGFENIVVPLRPLQTSREEFSKWKNAGGWTDTSLGLREVLYPPASPFSGVRNLNTHSTSVLARMAGAGLIHPRELLRLLYTGKRLLDVVSWLERQGVVHCHAHFAHYPAELAWGCSCVLGTTFSWNAHSYDLRLYSAHLKQRIRDADLVFPISEDNRRFIQEQITGEEGSEAIREKLRIIRCGIRLGDYSLGVEAETSCDPILLGVGRLVDTKGFADLIRAASLLLRDGIRVTVRIIGEGPERPNLLALASSLGCQDRIELMGSLPRDQVREEQRRATLLVMPCCPGRNGLDGIPVVLMEAMALGTPVVATRFAAIPELVKDGVNGRLIPPSQPEVLAGVIRDLLASPSRRHQLALAARGTIEAEFDGPRNYREKARLVKQLIHSKQGLVQ